MDNGWICLHRGMLEWEWIDDHNTFRVFMFMLMSANHKDGKWQGIEIKKGSFVFGRDKFAKKTSLSVQQVRTSIDKLKSTSEITIKTYSKYSIISITNWGKYQSSNQQDNQQSTSNQPASNQQVTTNNNVTIKQLNNVTSKDNTRKKNGAPNHDDILSLFHKYLSTLPRVLKLNETRRRRVSALSKKDIPSIEAWEQFFITISESDFLMGRAKDFKASFDWIIKPENALKIAEGNYTNKLKDNRYSKTTADNIENTKNWMPPEMRD